MAKKTKGTKMPAAIQLGRLGGKEGGPARARVLSPRRRSQIAKMGAMARRRKSKGPGSKGLGKTG